MSKNIQDLAEDLSKLTVLELSELSKLLEEKWGVKAAAPVAMAAAPVAGAGAAPAVEEATSFDVILESAPEAKKIGAIKIVRALTNLGLKEAKDFVESLPKLIKAGATKNEADDIVKQFKEVEGAKVTVKPAA